MKRKKRPTSSPSHRLLDLPPPHSSHPLSRLHSLHSRRCHPPAEPACAPPPSRPSAPVATVDLSDTSHLSSLPLSSSLLPLPDPSAPPPLSLDTLHVSNLPPGATSALLSAAFAPYGPVTSVSFPPAASYAFVHFASPAAAAAALSSSPPVSLASHPLTLSYAKGRLHPRPSVDPSSASAPHQHRMTYAELERELTADAHHPTGEGGDGGEGGVGGEEDGFDAVATGVEAGGGGGCGVDCGDGGAVEAEEGVAGGGVGGDGGGVPDAGRGGAAAGTRARSAISYDDLALQYS